MSNALVTNATRNAINNGTSWGSELVEVPTVGTLLFEDDFSSGDLSKWNAGGVPEYIADDVGMAHSMRCYYDGVSGVSNRIAVPISSIAAENLSEIFIEFDAKFDGYSNSKWVKIHGQTGTDNWANSTFSPNGNGDIYILFGAGTGEQNDAQSNVRTSGTFATSGTPNPPTGSVVENATAVGALMDYDNTWHSFKLRAKFSDAGEGLYEVWKDGTLEFRVINLTNKHSSNLPIATPKFFDWSAGGDAGYQSFANIKILKNGWSS